MKDCNVWSIDNGAAFTGKLTVMDVDTKEFWQSDAV
jgi:serine/threonine protein phosphatase 1